MGAEVPRRYAKRAREVKKRAKKPDPLRRARLRLTLGTTVGSARPSTN
jgi:hypothetical protein